MTNLKRYWKFYKKLHRFLQTQSGVIIEKTVGIIQKRNLSLTKLKLIILHIILICLLGQVELNLNK